MNEILDELAAYERAEFEEDERRRRERLARLRQVRTQMRAARLDQDEEQIEEQQRRRA